VPIASQRAHILAERIAACRDDPDAKQQLAEMEGEIDRAAASLWGLTDAELVQVRKALDSIP
jgi:hypothetical protein